MKILGISCFYHDAAAALVVDGRLVAAASEERFTRIKHDPELPANAVNFCLKRGGIDIDEVDYRVATDKRSIIPAVTHIDHSARLQTVAEEDNPLLYHLLVAFGRQTGVPVLLNTSFNLRGHPVVNRPEEAFATFCSGAIDILLMGSYVIDKDQVSDRRVQQFALDAQPD